MLKLGFVLIHFCVVCLLIGCASARKEPKVPAAVLDSQLYFIDNGMPIREVKKDQQFFFKKCSVDNRSAYPSKTNYDCNEPDF